jgi:hypothetical protein
LGLVVTRGRSGSASAEGDDDVNGTSPGRAINPTHNPTQSASGPADGPTRPAWHPVREPAQPASEPADGASPPVRRVVRLDAEYLDAGARSQPAPHAIEPEEEQLIVLPRRSGSWFARLFRWLGQRLFG